MKGNYTKSANNALKYAKKIAQKLAQEYVGSEHLLLGLLKEKNGTGISRTFAEWRI